MGFTKLLLFMCAMAVRVSSTEMMPLAFEFWRMMTLIPVNSEYTIASSMSPHVSSHSTSSSTALRMVPKFDASTNRWVPSSPEESAEAGYDIWGSLIRQGPKPFFARLFASDNYDQGVMKMMATDTSLDRQNAQAEALAP